MKVAVAAQGDQVSQHFGYCELFRIYTIENKAVVKVEDVKNPGHRPGYLPVFLKENGVNVIIAGGMGGSAVDLFNENGIEVIMGNLGPTEDIISKYIAGKLESTGSACHDHTMHQD